MWHRAPLAGQYYPVGFTTTTKQLHRKPTTYKPVYPKQGCMDNALMCYIPYIPAWDILTITCSNVKSMHGAIM